MSQGDRTANCGRLAKPVVPPSGGSMRISDIQELMEGYKREGIPADPYYW